MDVAAKLQLHKSTAHRLLMILERHRMVMREPNSGRYRLGLRLFELGALAIARFNIRDCARPHLERVLFETEETVHLLALENATATAYFRRAAKLDPQGHYGGLAKQRLP